MNIRHRALGIISTTVLTLFLALIAPLTANAHSPLNASIPAQNSAYSAPFEKVELTFGKPARLTKLTIESMDEKELDADLSDHKDFALEHTIAISPIPIGEYTLQWRALSQDGHPIRGSISFSVQ